MTAHGMQGSLGDTGDNCPRFGYSFFMAAQWRMDTTDKRGTRRAGDALSRANQNVEQRKGTAVSGERTEALWVGPL